MSFDNDPMPCCGHDPDSVEAIEQALRDEIEAGRPEPKYDLFFIG